MGFFLDIDFHIGLPKSEAYRAARFGHFGATDFMLACLTEPSMWNLLLKMFMDPEQRVMKASASVIEQVFHSYILFFESTYIRKYQFSWFEETSLVHGFRNLCFHK